MPNPRFCFSRKNFGRTAYAGLSPFRSIPTVNGLSLSQAM